MTVEQIISLATGAGGGMVVSLFFVKFLLARLAECEKKHEKVTRALIAVAASDAKISAEAITKMLE